MTTTNPTATTTATVPASTDLAIAEKTALASLNKSLAKNDLDDLLRGARRSLLLVDCSGSMNERIKSGARKIEQLRETVTTMRQTNSFPMAAFGAYGADVQVVDVVPEACGQTPLDRAIQFGQHEGATHLVVVTDGQPDDARAALAAGREFGNPIDVIYIGDGNDEGSRFAAELARITGGSCSLTDLGKPKELAGKICLMLGDGN